MLCNSYFKITVSDLKGSGVIIDDQESMVTMTSPQAPFPPSSWKYILRLLGLCIIIDRKVFKDEVDAFQECAIELRDIIDPTVCLTKKMAYDWFRLNKHILEDIRDNMSLETALFETLAPIKSISHKSDIISCMVKIAISDGEYCAKEKNLIKKTCLFWNVRSDPHHDFDAIFSPDSYSKLVHI